MAIKADVDLSVTVSRTALGLGPLEIANSPDYFMSPQFLGKAVEWDRKTVTSQWLDGGATVSRHRNMVTEQIGVEVKGSNHVDMRDLINVLIAAFTQDTFLLTVTVGPARYVYTCEAADYTNASWTTPRLSSSQGQVIFNVPRQPRPSFGGN